MASKTYMIIEADPDGDSYELHNELQKAKKSFEEIKKSNTFWGEGTIYLIEVKDKKFGFGSRGDMFGAEVIESHTFEE
jgi:hypothetical protein